MRDASQFGRSDVDDYLHSALSARSSRREERGDGPVESRVFVALRDRVDSGRKLCP
jgi:hypothetical protein